MYMEQLTLICPTYNRHYYLLRSIKYWSRFCFRVIYVDGSDNSLNIPFKLNSNITYIHSPVSFAKRLQQCVPLLNTPYCALLCDDEFYLPAGLNQSINFLNSNSAYVSCIGRSIGFRSSECPHVYSSVYPGFHDRNLSSNNHIERLVCHFSNYAPSHFYSVIRSDVFKSTLLSSLAFKVDVYALFELIFEFLVVANGKSCVIPCLHWLRSFDAKAIRNNGELGFTTTKSFSNWWFSKTAANERSAFCNYLSKSTQNLVSPKEVYEIFSNYVAKSPSPKRTPKRIFDYLISSLLSSLPLNIKALLKRMVRIVFPGMLRLKSDQAISDLVRQKVYIDSNELDLCLQIMANK